MVSPIGMLNRRLFQLILLFSLGLDIGCRGKLSNQVCIKLCLGCFNLLKIGFNINIDEQLAAVVGVVHDHLCSIVKTEPTDHIYCLTIHLFAPLFVPLLQIRRNNKFELKPYKSLKIDNNSNEFCYNVFRLSLNIWPHAESIISRRGGSPAITVDQLNSFLKDSMLSSQSEDLFPIRFSAE